MALTKAPFVVRECKFAFPSMALKWWAQLSGGLWQQLSFAHLQISHMGQSVRSALVRSSQQRAPERAHAGLASGRRGDGAARLATHIHFKRSDRLMVWAAHGATGADGLQTGVGTPSPLVLSSSVPLVSQSCTCAHKTSL